MQRHVKKGTFVDFLQDCTKWSRILLFVFNGIVSMLKTDFYVCGLAPLGEDLVVLAFVTEGPKQEVSAAFSHK